MFSMHRQLTFDGSTKLTKEITMLPKNDGEIYRLWAGGDRWGWKFCHINKKALNMTEEYQLVESISHHQQLHQQTGKYYKKYIKNIAGRPLYLNRSCLYN
jgi:hypothetical protein